MPVSPLTQIGADCSAPIFGSMDCRTYGSATVALKTNRESQ